MIKIKLNQLVVAVSSGSLQHLVRDEFIPIATKFRLSRLRKQIYSYVEEFQEKRQELMHQSCELDDKGFLKLANGEAKFISADAQRDFHTQIKELGEAPIELTGEAFVLSDFEPRKLDAPELFNAEILANLDWLIFESKPEESKTKEASA